MFYLSILGVALFLILRKIRHYYHYDQYVFYSQSQMEQIGTTLLKIEKIKNMYEKEIDKYYDEIRHKNRQKWVDYGDLITQIPDHGLTYEQCDTIITQYTQLTQQNLANKQFSGTIYPLNTDVETSWIQKDPNDDLYQQLQKLYAKIFIHANLWNALHDGEFPATAVINYQLIGMVADLFGGKHDQIMGLVTTGGTQSIMNAARTYCDYGCLKKSFHPTQCVIIAPQTIHASLMKAANAYQFKLILLPVDQHGYVNATLLEETVDYYHRHLVALFCSYPSYPYGTRDDYLFFAKLAERYQVGCHIDCCLGGFILNFEAQKRDFLNLSGVTSVSADTHKNGLAPKGSSVLMYKDLGGQNLMYYSVYTTIDWPGGLYGTPKDEGSQSCVEAFCAFITLLMIGKKRYAEIAEQVQQTCADLEQYLSTFDGIKLLGGQPLNVVAFQLNDQYQVGSSYQLADRLKEKGLILNTLLDDKLHFCVTTRFASEATNLVRFKEAFKACYEQVIVCQSQEIDGRARLYCSVDAMLIPQKTQSSFWKYLENFFLGRLGVRDVIRYHFLSIINPFYNYKKS